MYEEKYDNMFIVYHFLPVLLHSNLFSLLFNPFIGYLNFEGYIFMYS